VLAAVLISEYPIVPGGHPRSGRISEEAIFLAYIYGTAIGCVAFEIQIRSYNPPDDFCMAMRKHKLRGW
jgi:hypothetical protein